MDFSSKRMFLNEAPDNQNRKTLDDYKRDDETDANVQPIEDLEGEVSADDSINVGRDEGEFDTDELEERLANGKDAEDHIVKTGTEKVNEETLNMNYSSGRMFADKHFAVEPVSTFRSKEPDWKNTVQDIEDVDGDVTEEPEEDDLDEY